MLPWDIAKFGGYAAQTVKSGSSSVIKSITTGTISIAGASLTGTFTSLPTVDTTKTILIYQGTQGASTTNNYQRTAIRLSLTNATTVTATREDSTSAASISFTAIEFASGVNSLQYGTIAITTGNTTNTAAITSVGANAFVLYLGESISTASLSYMDTQAGVVLTNATTVTANIGASHANTTTVGFVVADLDSTIVDAAPQKITITDTTTAASYTQTITSTSTARSVVFFNGQTFVVAGGGANNAHSLELTNATTVTAARPATGSTTSRTIYGTVVEFTAAALNGSIQRAEIAVSAGASNTATITSIDTTKSFANYNGQKGPGSASAPNTSLCTQVLTNATTVTTTCTATPASAVTTGFEVVQFA